MKQELLNTVLRLCSMNGWNYELVEHQKEDITEVVPDSNSVAELSILVGNFSIAFYTNYTQPVLATKFSEMCEFIARANQIQAIGNLELDMQTGKLRHKCYTVWENSVLPNVPILEKYCAVGTSFFKNYKPGIDAIIKGELSPSAVLKLYNERNF